jgi:benzoyl-CoA reductase/2-hydroxyglutaryl-CoA dehydratase subunit BcrC/BadD/HgdB
MTTDYRPMWQDLGLNLANHDALLAVLGPLYAGTFQSQPNRPAGTAYLDFVMSEVHGLRIQELVEGKARGRKVVGAYCTFVPEELVLAADAVLVGLCAGADFAPEAAERLLPRNLCALIKSTFGFKLGGVCPYLEASDLVVGENTCDGKKKAWEVFGGIQPNLYVMDLPQVKGPGARDLLRAEYRRFQARLEELTGNRITPDKLAGAIRVVNAKRSALHRLARLRAADPAPISGLDSLLINQIAFFEDPGRFTAHLNALCDELEARVRDRAGVAPAGAPRILVSGCPMALPNWKLPTLVETSGAVIVGEESCIGERGSRNLVDGSGATLEELVDSLVDRHLAIDCAIFTPNPDRLEHVREMARACRADGVILFALQFCTPYTVEALGLEAVLEQEGIPAIRIETDYSQEDVAQLKTRIQAFVERLRA